MAERKTPILLARGPLSGEVFAFHDYTRTRRMGLSDLITAKPDGKQSVQADYDSLVLEELLGEDQGIIEILDNIVHHGYGEDISEGDRVTVRALLKRLTAIIERHNARIGEESYPHVDS